jgi:hypothetical protein
MLSSVITYLVLRDNMSKKHYEKIMGKRSRRVEKVVELLEKRALEDQPKESLYMNTDGTIDWVRLAEHVREATSGR